MNILSIDWDYFFPIPNPTEIDFFRFYDWGMRDNDFFLGCFMWTHRAYNFLVNNKPLPETKDHTNFFSDAKIRIAPKAPVFVSESHAMICSNSFIKAINSPVQSIWSYDAHHDAGYPKNPHLREWRENPIITCENWVYFYADNRVPVRIIYPKWRKPIKHAEPRPRLREERHKVTRKLFKNQATPVFDLVFICRSGQWVPPWCDNDFDMFIKQFNTTKLQPVENRAREFWQALDVYKEHMKIAETQTR